MEDFYFNKCIEWGIVFLRFVLVYPLITRMLPNVYSVQQKCIHFYFRVWGKNNKNSIVVF